MGRREALVVGAVIDQADPLRRHVVIALVVPRAHLRNGDHDPLRVAELPGHEAAEVAVAGQHPQHRPLPRPLPRGQQAAASVPIGPVASRLPIAARDCASPGRCRGPCRPSSVAAPPRPRPPAGAPNGSGRAGAARCPAAPPDRSPLGPRRGLRVPGPAAARHAGRSIVPRRRGGGPSDR